MSRMVADSRRWAAWLRDSFGARLVPVAVAILHMGRTCFATSWDPETQDILYERASLRTLLQHDSAAEWLRQNGAALPSWLG